MRIIGGSLSGKKIIDPIDKSTRPLKDLVRESIFNKWESIANDYKYLAFNYQAITLFYFKFIYFIR